MRGAKLSALFPLSIFRRLVEQMDVTLIIFNVGQQHLLLRGECTSFHQKLLRENPLGIWAIS